MSRVFGLIFRSNRPANIALIKEIGVEAYANEMAPVAGRASGEVDACDAGMSA